MKNWLWIGGGLVVLALFVLPALGIGAGQALGFLLVLLCPLMHFFMGHGGHGGHGHAGHADGSEPPRKSAAQPQVLPASDGGERWSDDRPTEPPTVARTETTRSS